MKEVMIDDTDTIQLSSAEDVCRVVADVVCSITSTSIHDVNGSAPFSTLGLDSLGITALVHELSLRWRMPLSETIVFQNPNIFDLALALAHRLGLECIGTNYQELQNDEVI